MRVPAFVGILCFMLATTIATGGDAAKEKPFKELATEDLSGLLGAWEAAISTTNGWKGTLRANIALKRNNPEVSVFHNLMVLRYDLKFTDKKTKVEATAAGTERIALIPYQKGTQRYVQLLRDFQVQQKEFLIDLLDFRPSDNKAARELADMHATTRDTAAIWIEKSIWTLEASPSVLEFLPKKAASGPNIDWESRIVWKQVKSKS